MDRILTRYPNKSQRALEILIPLVSWVIITMPLWLSFWHPAIVAYFVITFDMYWFYKSFTLAFHGIRSFLTLTAHTNVNWLAKARKEKHFKDLWHVVIIPEYKEPIHILRRTLDNLRKQTFPKKRMIVVIGTEANDPSAAATATLLKKEYEKIFGHLLITEHKLQPGEIAGKSSNMAHAGREAERFVQTLGIDMEYVTVTSCDADALLHPKYLSYLSLRYLTNPLRRDTFYQGAILFYSNIWRIPLPNRILNTLGSIFNLANLSQGKHLINFSTYSVSFATVKQAGFWSADVIPEDYHLFFKTYFARGERVSTHPIYLPILVDAAESHGFWNTMVNQYEQYKRWAYGVSDIPFVIKNAVMHREIPAWDRITRVAILLERHILWPTNWFILTIGATIPPLVNANFARTALGHNLSQISSGILTLSAIFLLVILIIDARIRPPKPKEFPSWKVPLLYIQWITLPLISFFLSALPGLDAHTRLLLGKKLKYRVTEKV